MEPTIKENDMVMFRWFKKGEDLKDRDIIICRANNDELKIKRFLYMKNYVLLLSDNKDHDPIVVDDADSFETIGKLVNILK